MNKTTSNFLAAFAAVVCLSANAADPGMAAAGAALSRDEAKDLKSQSEGQYKARKKVAEANQTLNETDCKTALTGSAKRACNKSAEARAKSDKADAKTVHEAEEQAIKGAKK